MISKKDIVASVETYFNTNFTACTITWPESNIKTTGLAEWVECAIVGFGSEARIRGQDIERGEVHLNICCKKHRAGVTTFRIFELQDLVEPLFQQVDVPLLTGPGTIRFREVQGRVDGNVPVATEDCMKLALMVLCSIENV